MLSPPQSFGLERIQEHQEDIEHVEEDRGRSDGGVLRHFLMTRNMDLLLMRSASDAVLERTLDR
jgi:hypothetical protein